MKAEDTVMKAGDLCIMVCRNHRSRTLEAKDCTGEDCEECQLEAQAGVSFKAGEGEMVEWMKRENDKNPQVLDGSSIIVKLNPDRWRVKQEELGINEERT